MATYKHLRSSTANKRPTTSITDGQLAINTNTASPGLFFKDSAGTGIVKVGPVHVGTTAPNATPAAGGSTGNYTGEQWLDTSVSPAQMKVWNGSAWVGVVADELPVSKLQDGAARQLLQTDAAGTGVEWTSNVDVPGTLDVTGATTLDSTLTVPLGSAASPTLRFSGDANSGLYSPGADQVAVSTGGTGRLFVDASGRVGVGATPSIYRLDVGGNGIRTRESDDSSALVLGTYDAGGYVYISSDKIGTGSYQPLVFSTGGSERLRVTSAGLVGIGSSDPTSGTSSYYDDLVVKNATSGTGAGITIQSNSTNGFSGLNLRKADGTDLGKFVAGSSDGKLYIETAGLAAITIDSSQRVGIGTASPNLNTSGTAVHVSNASSGNAAITRYTTGDTGTAATDGLDVGMWSDGDAFFWLRESTSIRFATASTERGRWDANGRFLVGTSAARSNFFNTTVSSALDVEVSTDALIEFSGIRNRNNADGAVIALAKSRGTTAGSNTIVTSGDGLGRVSFQGSDGSEFVEAAVIQAEVDGTPGANDMPGRLVFSTTPSGSSSPTQRMRIRADGIILMNTTSNDPAATVGHQFNPAGQYFGSVADSTSAANTLHVYSINAAAYRFYVGMDGTVNATNTTISAISDQRFKENIRDLDVGLNQILALQPRRFDWKPGKGKDIQNDQGFIAQEFEQIFPEMVGEWLDPAPEGEEPYKSVRADLIPVLVKAIQEQQAIINGLEARLAALEAS
jgi:hypothetical protein